MVSTLTGRIADDGELGDPEYWVRHARHAVRFADAVTTLAGRGVTVFGELGPDSTLAALARESLAEGDTATVAGLLRRDRDEETTLVTGLATLAAGGAGVDWPAFFAGTGARRVALPTYAFQHARFWPEPVAPATVAPAGAAGDDSAFWDVVERGDLAGLAGTLGVEHGELSAVLPALGEWRRRHRERSVTDGWRQRITWTPLTGLPRARPSGTWLAVLPAGLAGDAWVRATLDALGTGVIPIEVGAGTPRAELAAQLSPHVGAVSGVLSLLALAGPEPDAVVPAGTTATATLVQALGDAGLPAPLWAVTRGAVSVAATEAPARPEQAGVWGLGRVAALEHPDRWGGLVDLPEAAGDIDDVVAARLAAILAGHEHEDQVAIRASAAFGRRLVAAGDPDDDTTWEPTGTVLITGGTGALGAQVARHLATTRSDDGRAPHLLLAGRRGPDAPGADDLVAELTGLGAQVTVAACDVADRAQLTALLDGVGDERPLTAVVHTAGVLDDGVLDGLTPERFAAVFRSKVTSALLLDELTGDLDAFVLFASASAAVGNAGQANYAAANAVLDALAERRRATGRAATSISWGAWGGAGMAAGADAEEVSRRTGVTPMDPDRAVATLRRLAGGHQATAVVSDVDLARFVRTFTAARPSPLLRELPGYADLAATTPEPAGTDSGPSLREKLAGLSPARRRRTLLELVCGRTADILGYGGADEIGPDRAFRDLGFDSLAAVELRNQLGAATGLSLSATLVFDHATPGELADHIGTELGSGSDSGSDPGPDAQEVEEAGIRALLASVPLELLRESGLLDPVLALAGSPTHGHAGGNGHAAANGHTAGNGNGNAAANGNGNGHAGGNGHAAAHEPDGDDGAIDDGAIDMAIDGMALDDLVRAALDNEHDEDRSAR